MGEISVAPKKDPITEAFLNKQPSQEDISDSLAEMLSSPTLGQKTSFGEALNQIRGAKIKEATTLETIKQGRQRLGIAERGQKIRKMQYELDLAKQHKKDFSDIWESVTDKMSLENKAKLYEWAKSPQSGAVDSGDIRGNLLRGVTDLKIKKAPKEFKPTTAEIKRDALLREGYSQEDAEGLAFGHIGIYTDPITGQHYRIDKRTGAKTATSIPTRAGLPKKLSIALQTQNVEIDKLLSRVPDLETAIEIAGGGIQGQYKDLLSKLGGQVPEEYRDLMMDEADQEAIKQVIEARNTIGLFREDMRKALSANPRMSLPEQTRILGLLPTTEIMSSIEDNKAKLNTVQDRLKSVQQDNNINLGLTSGFSGSRDNPAKPASQKEFDDLKSGTYFINPKDGSLRRK